MVRSFRFIGAAALCCLLAPASAELTLETLRQRQEHMRAAIRATGPAVVAIRFPDGSVEGSGVIVREDGLILTAAHVSGESNRKVTIIMPDGERLDAKTLGSFRSLDAGMVQILADERRFPVVPMGSSDTLTLGQWCLAIGHPGGFIKERPAPVRLGRILSKDANGFILTDSTLSGGDSGGPLLDLQGRLIGIHSSIGIDLTENRHVPIQVFRQQWEPMKEGKVIGRLYDWDRREAAFLGVQIDPEAHELPGAHVVSVVKHSPAAVVGLRAGDRILALDEKEIPNGQHFLATLRHYQPDDVVSLSIAHTNDAPRTAKTRLKRRRDFLPDRNPQD